MTYASPYPGSPALSRAGGSVPTSSASRGPWLASRLYCPAGSTLTMASSEPLVRSRRLLCFRRLVFARRPRPEGPQFKLRVFRSVPSSLPRRSGGRDCCSSTRFGLRPLGRGSTSAISRLIGSRRGDFSRLTIVRLSLRPGSLLALHRQGRLLSSFRLMSHLTERRI
jgi:hypothetical protein